MDGRQGEPMSISNIIYCCPGKATGSRRVERILELLCPDKRYEVFQEIPVFEKYIRSYLSHEHLIILRAEKKQHLRQFVALEELLIGHRIILILPDNDQETLARGHSLRPRFITYRDADFREIAFVLSNILRPEDHNRNTTRGITPAEGKKKAGNRK